MSETDSDDVTVVRKSPALLNLKDWLSSRNPNPEIITFVGLCGSSYDQWDFLGSVLSGILPSRIPGR